VIRRDAKEHGSYLEDQSGLRQLRVDWLSTICHYYGLSPNAIDISSDELMRRCGQFDLDVEVPRYIDQYISRCESKGPDAVDAQYRCAAERARSARVTGDGEPNGSAVVGVPPGALAPAEVAAQGSQTPAERAKTSFLLAMAEPVPLATHRAWVSPWERDMPLPPRPYLGFDLECKLLASTDADAQSVQRRLEESVPDAFDVRVWRVHRQAHETKYKLEADRIGNEQLLWHSSSNTDPTELVFSGYPFDKTKSGGGSYGEGLYFSKHAIYGGRILPCRVSQLDVADGLRGELPQVGDDVMLVGRDRDLATYCIEGVTGDMFSIRKLRWDAHRKEAVEPKQIRLGDGRGDSTLWRFADRRYSILASVALGKCRDYGRDCKDTLRGPPSKCHSVSGTELDLHIKQVVNRREWYPEWTADYEPLAKHGSKYGEQYVVPHEDQACPRFIVRYRRRRTVSAQSNEPSASRPPDTRAPSGQPKRKRGMREPVLPSRQPERERGMGLANEKWRCMNCRHENDGSETRCVGLEKRGGRKQRCGRKREY